MKKIGILGGGVWGSALAKLLSNNKVFIYARDKKTIKSINDHKFNPKLKYVFRRKSGFLEMFLFAMDSPIFSKLHGPGKYDFCVYHKK